MVLSPVTVPATGRTALLAGATGLVGRALAQEIAASERYQKLHLLLRRRVPDFDDEPKIQPHEVDLAALPDPLPVAEDIYIAVGTTLKQAGSKQAFRRVDFDLVFTIASKARAAGGRRLAVVSALGADAGSRIFYNRVKGEMEAALSKLNYDSVVFAQPSLLLGDRVALGQPVRLGEAWAQRLLAPLSGLLPARARPIRAVDVAAAMVTATLEARPGVHVLASRDMQHARVV